MCLSHTRDIILALVPFVEEVSDKSGFWSPSVIGVPLDRLSGINVPPVKGVPPSKSRFSGPPKHFTVLLCNCIRYLHSYCIVLTCFLLFFAVTNMSQVPRPSRVCAQCRRFLPKWDRHDKCARHRRCSQLAPCPLCTTWGAVQWGRVAQWLVSHPAPAPR